MKTNMFKRIAALAAAAMMTLSMNAFAEDTSVTKLPAANTNEFTFLKEVTTDGSTMSPNTTFEFTVATGTASNVLDQNKNSIATYDGVADSLSVGSAVFAATDAAVASDSYTHPVTLTADSTKFTHAGIYEYTLTESNNTYEGITSDTTTHRVLVYVQNGTTAGSLVVSNVVFYKNGVKTDRIVNDYGKTNDTTHDVTLSKVVTGAQADLTKKFSFIYAITSLDTNKLFKVVTTIDGKATTVYNVKAGNTYTVKIGNNDSVQIYGLTATDKVTFDETSFKADYAGYSASNSVNGVSTTTETANGKIVGTITKDGSTATVTNTQEAVTPTGIVLQYAPYILMILAAGVLAVVFLRRRDSE